MITKSNNLRRVFALMLAMILLTGFPVPVQAASYQDASKSDSPAPIAAVRIGSSGTGAAGEDLTICTKYGKHYLFLPSSANLSNVSVRYTGEKQLYDPVSDAYYSQNQTAALDFSAGNVEIYEYDAQTKSYTKYALVVMKSANVPSLYITLDEAEHPGYADTLSWLNSNKENCTTATLLMTDGDGNTIYNGDVDKFKGRGNTSFVAPGFAADKKSFSVKLAKKAELIEGAGKSKKWALLHIRVSDAYYYDFTGMTSLLGFQTYTALAGDDHCGMKGEYADVYIDGDYRGTYILTERADNKAAIDVTDQEDFISSSSSERQTVQSQNDPAIAAGIQWYRYTKDAVLTDESLDITGGYVLEVNYGNLEECGFVTEHGLYVDIKSPEACTKEQVQYIAKYTQEFENALYSPTGYNKIGKHYTEYIDSESLASLILTYAFFENWELFRTSTYLYIDSESAGNHRLVFGPAWDFETGDQVFVSDPTLFGRHNTYTAAQQYAWLEQLWQKGDFMQLLRQKELQLSDIIETVLGTEENVNGLYTAQGLTDFVRASQTMNWTRWGYEHILNSKGEYAGHSNSFEYYADRYITRLNTRFSNWQKLWDESKYLYGVSISGYRARTDGTLLLICDAQTSGEAAYQWYRTEDSKTEGTAIAGATTPKLMTNENGLYYCVVSGGNNAYSSNAAGSVFSSKTLSVTSAIYDTADASLTDTLPEGEHIAGDWEISKEASCTEAGLRVRKCRVCAQIVETQEIPETGHTAGAWKITKLATKTEEGLRVKICTVCGEQAEQSVIAKYVNRFTDVDESRWYEEAIRFGVQSELFEGMGNSIFAPDKPMSRAMLVCVLARLEGAEINNQQNCVFKDVPSGKWYTGAVVWASENDIVNGVSTSKFCPDDNVTREQTATILHRYAAYKGYDTKARGDLSAYRDRTEIHSYAQQAMSWANQYGIITGMSSTELAPQGNSTRAQAAKMLFSFCQAFEGL